MNTPDQLEALRDHLDSVLTGVGDGLPRGAAPALLAIAHRRTRTRRIAAGTGGLAVAALVAVGVSASVMGSASKSSVLTPADGHSLAPTVAATDATDGPLRITHRAASPADLGNETAGVFLGTTRVILGPQAGTAAEKTPGTLSIEDLTTGEVRTVATDLTAPLSASVAIDGDTAYLVQGDAGKAVVARYDVTTGVKLGETPLPSPSTSACGHPVNSCVHAQVDATSVGLVDGRLLVTTPNADDTSAVVLVLDPTTGRQLDVVGVPGQNQAFVGSIGAVGYFASPGQLLAVSDSDGLHVSFGDTGSAEASIVVGANGIYVTTNDKTGGPDPSRPTTFTLKRLDPTTLAVTTTVAEKVPGTSSAALSVATIGTALYTTLGDCPSAPTTDVCISQRDPVTLANTGTALRFTPPKGALINLAESLDGHAAVTIRASGATDTEVDLLGRGATG